MSIDTECTICHGPFDMEAEGGIAGEVGVFPVTLCPACLTGLMNLFERLPERHVNLREEYGGVNARTQ